MALAAVEVDLSAKEEELAALKAAVSEIDLKVPALQAEVEDLNLPYKVVTSGRDCKYITTKEECLEAAKALGFATTIVEVRSDLSPRPPGCRINDPTRDVAFLNTDPNGNADCGYKSTTSNTPWDCICKK